MVTVDGETGDELERRNLVKGYEFKKGHFLILTDDDLESVKVETSAVMTVEKFVDASSIDPIYYDSSYYLVPDGKAGADVYAVLREAVQQTGRVALSRVVISQRERTIALRVMDGGLVAHALHEERDLNSAKPLFEDAQDIKTDPDLVNLAVQLIDRQTSRYDPADTEDRYETWLRAMIDPKLKGEGIEAEPEPNIRDNVVDLRAALKKSLGRTAEKEAARPVVASKKKAPSSEEARRQPGLKLPIKGGKGAAASATAAGVNAARILL